MPGRYTDHLVRADQAGQVSPVLRRVLRHQALRHDRLGLRDGAAGIPEHGSAAAAGEGSLAQSGEKLFEQLGLHQLPQGGQHGPRPDAGRVCSASGAARPAAARSKADETYIRESILQPSAKVVAATSRSCRPTRDWSARRSSAADRVHQVDRSEDRRRRSAGAPAEFAGIDARQALDHMITAAAQEREHYLNASYGLKSWLLTKDHKRIALLYLVTDHPLLLRRRRLRDADPRWSC